MIEIPPAALDLVKRHEGLRLRPYRCPAGYPTIGWGHRLADRDVLPSVFGTITEETATALLAADLRTVADAVDRMVRVPISQNQRAALISFAFNLGAGALRGSTLLARLNAGDPAGAAEEFGRWIHANGKPLDGLVARRAAEKALFLQPDAAPA